MLYAVLFFVNGFAAFRLGMRGEFADWEIEPRFRTALMVFGAVFYLLGIIAISSAAMEQALSGL